MNVPGEAITLADDVLQRAGACVSREDVREALEAAAPHIAAAEREHIRQSALDQAAIWEDSGWQAIVRSALEEFAASLPPAPSYQQYRVRAVPWEGGQELHIEGVGVTQSCGIEDAAEVAADLIRRREGLADGEPVSLDITWEE